MRNQVITAGIALVTVIIALGLFFAGFFVRGYVDQNRGVSAFGANGDSQPGENRAPGVVGQLVVNDVSADDDPYRGSEQSPVTIVEFSDFECPYCQSFAEQVLPQLFDVYGEDVRFVFRDFPITSIHPQAFKAAEAAQCAFEQGEFWRYHDLLFQNQGALDLTNLKKSASTLGMDTGIFDDCLDSGSYEEEVQADLEDGQLYGVSGTPTFFINGRKVVGAQPFAVFQQIIEEELEKSNDQ